MHIAIFAGNIHVPSFEESFVSYTGNAAVPLSMILIGAFMAQQNVRELFADRKMYVFLAIRLLLASDQGGRTSLYKGECSSFFMREVGTILTFVYGFFVVLIGIYTIGYHSS